MSKSILNLGDTLFELDYEEKGADNDTKLFTLEKFKVRYDKVVAKDYLAGKYGAVPVFKDLACLWHRGSK